HFKDGWRDVAIKKPELVAEYLYKYQDEGRFGADPRLLVVYIDETDFVRYNLVEGEVYSISIVYDVKSFFCDNNQPDGIYYRAIELVILP
ncbi:MAG: hypothetical protein UU72_C0026G0026, partial [candidate division WWE3 bacterium GW2011_GWB1_41_6]